MHCPGRHFRANPLECTVGFCFLCCRHDTWLLQTIASFMKRCCLRFIISSGIKSTKATHEHVKYISNYHYNSNTKSKMPSSATSLPGLQLKPQPECAVPLYCVAGIAILSALCVLCGCRFCVCCHCAATRLSWRALLPAASRAARPTSFRRAASP